MRLLTPIDVWRKIPEPIRPVVALASLLTALDACIGPALSGVWRQALTIFSSVPGAAVGGWLCCRASARKDGLSHGWRWMTLGCWLSGLAALLFTEQTIEAGAIVRGSELVNDLYGVGGLALFIGVGALLMPRDRRAVLSHVLDFALIIASCSAACWTLFIVPRLAQATGNGWSECVEVIYIVGELLLVLECAMALQAMPRSSSRNLVLPVVCGVLLMVGADSIYGYYRTQQHIAPGLWADIPWIWSFLAIGMAALVKDGAPESASVARLAEPAWNAVSGLAALVAAGIIVASDAKGDGQIWVGNVAVAGSLVVLFVARQLLVVRRNAQLLRQNLAYSERMASFNENLEHTVRERTRLLAALQSVTAATKSSLDEKDVLRVCAEGTQRALESDGCAVWLDGEPAPVLAVGDASDLPNVLPRIHDHIRRGTPAPEVGPFGLQVVYVYPDQLEGALLAAWRRGDPFSEEEDLLLESIGLELAVAVTNARTHARAAEEAQNDSVTGLLNLRTIRARLKAEIKRAQRSGEPLTVVMMDLDDFKIFNDTYGHPVGDAVLKHIAQVLRDNTRSFDLVGRYGGDEFVAVLPGTDRDTAGTIGERIRTVLYEEGFCGPDQEIPLRISYGIAMYPDNALTSNDLLSAADEELYQAKRRRGTLPIRHESLREGLSQIPGFDTLDAMVAAVDSRDRYTRRHAEEVTVLSVAIARRLGWNESELRSLRVAALLHNVGKIGVPESILRKPGSLTDEETALMQRHTDIGHRLVRSLETDELVWSAARYHHERWDGHGYPRRLAGEMIPVAARIIAVADGFCAMTTHRPYRRAMSLPHAVDVLRAGSGTQWDPTMVEAFLQVWTELQAFEPASA